MLRLVPTPNWITTIFSQLDPFFRFSFLVRVYGSADRALFAQQFYCTTFLFIVFTIFFEASGGAFWDLHKPVANSKAAVDSKRFPDDIWIVGSFAIFCLWVFQGTTEIFSRRTYSLTGLFTNDFTFNVDFILCVVFNAFQLMCVAGCVRAIYRYFSYTSFVYSAEIHAIEGEKTKGLY
jgi:hypothetical protein